MNLRLIPCIAAIAVTIPVVAQNTSAVYVSPSGSDNARGTAAHPVHSLPRAVELARAKNTGKSDVRVVLEDGVFRLTDPLELDAADSGKNGHNLVFTAMPGTHPVISGAVRIVGWRLIDRSRNLWSAQVPHTLANSRQLYVNGLRASRTRGRVPVALTETSIGYEAANAKLATWRNPSDMEFVYTGGNSIWSEYSEGLGAWTEPRCPVQSIHGATITVQQPCWDNSTKRIMLPNGARTANLVGPKSVGARPEYLENAYELLGTPGQFYFDRKSHVLYYVPRPGEDLRTADVEMPSLEALIQAAGTPQQPIHNIVFRGIQFSYATWLGPSSPQGFSEIQANYQVTGRDGYARQALCQFVPGGACPFGAWTQEPGNISFQFSHNIEFRDDDFVHLGAAGLTLGDGSQKDRVEGCIFTDISGNGVQFGGVDMPLAPIAQFTSGNTITNNLFRNVGAEYRGGIPIVVGYARDTIVAHNQIDHVPYAAISMGWGGWPDKIKQAGQANNSRGNIVADNLIHDLMLVLADGGGIYTQGLTGTNLVDGEKVTGNLVYNQFSSGHEIYTDNGSSMITVRGNVMFNANHDNWGSRHHDYYDGQDGKNYDPLLVADNYWQQGDPDSSKRNVTVQGNHLIASLNEVPRALIEDAGLQPPFKSALNARFRRLVPLTRPEAPSRVAASPGDGFAYVTFSPPVFQGRSAVVRYTVRASTGREISISAPDFAKYSFVRFPSLPNDAPVVFTVTALNAQGPSEASLPSFPVTPTGRTVALLPPPSSVSIYPGGHGEVSVHFQSPGVAHPGADKNPITSYEVTIEPGNRRVTFTGRNVLTLQDGKHTTFKVISGLTPGTYTFRLSAVNEAGPGAPAISGPVVVK
ncbi:MAG: fibronectin type III domain-containing protein [Acidobacteriota bacterium]